MKGSIKFVALCLVVFASVAGAYEYPLQFTPTPGYRGLVVAGYQITGNPVVGNCSCYTVSGNSGGKGGGSRGPAGRAGATFHKRRRDGSCDRCERRLHRHRQ